MKSLLLVDIQNDFLPTGTLPVPEGDQIIPLVNQLQKKFDLIVATQDWHPKNHQSFADFHGQEPGGIITLHGIEQVLWPVHCVQQSFGAQLAEGLETDGIEQVFQKGINPEVDSYSGFFDNGHQNDTGLAVYLVEKGISELFIVGLALDYCVRYTALDARKCGFNTSIIVDGTRGVNIEVGDSVKAVTEMSEAGVNIIQSMNILTSQ